MNETLVQTCSCVLLVCEVYTYSFDRDIIDVRFQIFRHGLVRWVLPSVLGYREPLRKIGVCLRFAVDV